MRKALSGPVLLFEWYTPLVDAPDLARTIASQPWRGAATGRWRLKSDGVAFGMVSVWDEGVVAKKARTAWTRSNVWRKFALSMASQPEVHFFVADGPAWTRGSGVASLALVTVDAENVIPAEGKRLRSPIPRERLPQIEGAALWAAIGHPGRLLVRAESGEGLEAAIARLGEAWGPEAEAPERWTVSIGRG